MNAGGVSDALSGPNKPWYTLARRLGLVGSLLGDAVTSIEVNALGNFTNHYHQPKPVAVIICSYMSPGK